MTQKMYYYLLPEVIVELEVIAQEYSTFSVFFDQRPQKPLANKKCIGTADQQ